MSARDPYLGIPLQGVQRIEASAGTGKTYTLATLVTRLVVERGLRVGQILAVTFTEAATQELRKRIRERLQLTLALLDAPPADDAPPEVVLTQQLLTQQRARGVESDDALRRRLRQATVDIDLAAIFTIHGFCARVLREHALATGQGFDVPELLANDRDLREQVAADLWRVHAQDTAGADDLLALWRQGHAELAKDLRALLEVPVLWPPALPLPEDPSTALAEAAAALQLAIEAHLEGARAEVARAFDDKVFDGRRARRASFDKAFDELQTGVATGHWPRNDKTHLQKLLPAQMRDYCKEGLETRLPASPLFDALAAWCAADDAMETWRAHRRAALLHRLRDDARARMAQRKRERRVQSYDDLIRSVADALDAPQGDALARQLRAQYAVALVDEFQDTDARQWRIFDRVFGSGSTEHAGQPPALFLIGDPKQAIYGFRGGDVHTYLAAGAVATDAPPLVHNFRSRPAVLAAVSALYANAGNVLSSDPDIRFHPVEPGSKRQDDDFLRDGRPAPALTVWQAPPPDSVDAKGKAKTAWRAADARDLATRACVAAIHGVLTDARAGRAQLKDKGALRPVQPGDIAVLVRTHNEATQVQRALALAGIPAVAAGKQSLFATDEAHELHVLLLALLHGGDDGRLRAALATVLVGQDAAAIDALDRDGDAHRRWQLQAQQWRERLHSGGPLALVTALCTAQAGRLLGLLDGERRVSNFLQLAETLQEAQRTALGLHGLVDWLARRIAEADPDDETQLLRLESDARRVQIVTLHKSKGLEYPLVFLPFVGIGGKAPVQKAGKRVTTHRDGARALHWPLLAESPEWDAALREWQRDQDAEAARLLYVGLTRAEHALWLATGPFYNAGKTALAPMLGNTDALRAAGVVFDPALPPSDLPRLPAEQVAAVPPARTPSRVLRNDWWVYSFSQLAKAEAGDASSAATLPAPGGSDESEVGETADDVPAEAEAFDARFAGNRYGVALHAALEHADFAAWRAWRDGMPAPADEARVIAEALSAQGYGEDALAAGVALTTRLVGHTLTVTLPEGVRLCDVPAEDRRAELEFQFALQPTRVDALLALLHAHGVVRDRDRFGLRHQLEGLMTGLIDLTYRHDGRWYVLDYKSNRLPGFDIAALQRAMAHSEYDLQALIYTLALHRWLRFRLGDAASGGGYDYARDFGGIRYLFCRGLDAASAASPGIHAQRFLPELVHALDALFGHAGATL